MWVRCTFWIEAFAFTSLLCFRLNWMKVHVYRGRCFLTTTERVRSWGESLTTGDRYWSGVYLKEVGMKGRKGLGRVVGSGWGERQGRKQWPGHALPLTRMQSEIWLSPFDPGNNAPAGGLRTCPLPIHLFPCCLKGIADLCPCEWGF